MKILVTVKRVPDPEQKLKFKDGRLDLSGANWIVNPFDEYAVETALRLTENAATAPTPERFGEIVVIGVGPKDAAQQIRSSLAMGADRALLVEGDDEALDADQVARVVCKVYEQEQPDLVLLGKQAVDGDSNQVGQLVAGRLGLPQATFACGLELAADRKSLTVQRETDAGVETKRVPLPAVVTVDLRIVLSKAVRNHVTPETHAYQEGPRYASLKGIMAAKKKELRETTFAELGVAAGARARTTAVAAPPGRKAGVKVGSIDELVDKLKNEAKVI